MGENSEQLVVGVAQIAPVWFDRAATLEKVLASVDQAISCGCAIVAFGEALVPGYPRWLERTNGAAFNSPIQKTMHAEYQRQAVQIERGDLEPLCARARAGEISIVVGIVECPPDRGHSLYASAVYIDRSGSICGVHRKLVPTYDERLAWAPGDGYGLRTHRLGAFTLGALNCWENWMPLARSALYAQGEDLHFALWPGSLHNTEDITRYLALESRSYVISVSGLTRASDIPSQTLHRELFVTNENEVFSNGGSCICAPDGSWVLEPRAGVEELFVATIDHARVREERQNFDPAGHYARPDVMSLNVNRERQRSVDFTDD
ncbi:MAG: carbon-nitrogen hydrolase family protein [Pseudomonadota bacterium]